MNLVDCASIYYVLHHLNRHLDEFGIRTEIAFTTTETPTLSNTDFRVLATLETDHIEFQLYWAPSSSDARIPLSTHRIPRGMVPHREAIQPLLNDFVAAMKWTGGDMVEAITGILIRSLEPGWVPDTREPWTILLRRDGKDDPEYLVEFVRVGGALEVRVIQFGTRFQGPLNEVSRVTATFRQFHGLTYLPNVTSLAALKAALPLAKESA